MSRTSSRIKLVTSALFLAGVLFTGRVAAQADPTLTPRARAVQAQVDNAHSSTKIRLQRELLRLQKDVARIRRAARHQAEAPSAKTENAIDRMERTLIEARQDLGDLLVSSDGSFDRFRARVETDFGNLQNQVRRYRAE